MFPIGTQRKSNTPSILPATDNREPTTRYYPRMPRWDRHRIFAFARFTTCRFVDDGCLQSAGALAYTSLFALVPLTAATLGVLSGFPAFVLWHDRITSFVFANFVPAAGDVVREYLSQFADNANK